MTPPKGALWRASVYTYFGSALATTAVEPSSWRLLTTFPAHTEPHTHLLRSLDALELQFTTEPRRCSKLAGARRPCRYAPSLSRFASRAWSRSAGTRVSSASNC